jgi:hypothetical protein
MNSYQFVWASCFCLSTSAILDCPNSTICLQCLEICSFSQCHHQYRLRFHERFFPSTVNMFGVFVLSCCRALPWTYIQALRNSSGRVLATPRIRPEEWLDANGTVIVHFEESWHKYLAQWEDHTGLESCSARNECLTGSPGADRSSTEGARDPKGREIPE